MRKAVIGHLKTIFGEESVGDSARLLRKFQKSDLPFIAVAVADTISPTDQNMPGERVDNRGFTVAIRSCVHEDDEDILGTLDALSTRIERALFDDTVLGMGGLINWRCAGTVGPEPQPVEDGMLVAATTTYTAGMLTLDSDPETNLHA